MDSRCYRSIEPLASPGSIQIIGTRPHSIAMCHFHPYLPDKAVSCERNTMICSSRSQYDGIHHSRNDFAAISFQAEVHRTHLDGKVASGESPAHVLVWTPRNRLRYRSQLVSVCERLLGPNDDSCRPSLSWRYRNILKSSPRVESATLICSCFRPRLKWPVG